jgi:hypothetical protein
MGNQGRSPNGTTSSLTPKHARWLNMTELDLSLLSRECLGKRRLCGACALHRETRAWSRRATRQRRTIQWTFACKRARAMFGYEPIKNARSRH